MIQNCANYYHTAVVIKTTTGASYNTVVNEMQARGKRDITVIQLTVDHIASNKNEQLCIKDLGGFVSSSGGIDHVNGMLAVSCSL
eukprot:1671192-Ditylum_brightwellii.AAC.1